MQLGICPSLKENTGGSDQNREPRFNDMVYSSAGQFGSQLNARFVWVRTNSGKFVSIAPGNGQPSGFTRS